MIYTPLTNKAIKVMFEAHKDQLDKSGIPYVFHPWHIAESMEDEIRCTVALLHDVVEDTKITISELRKMGFPEDVLVAVDLLTHKESEDYATYINNIIDNDIAIDVKIKDLEHNLDKSRLVDNTSLSNIKYQLYESSLKSLKQAKKLKKLERVFGK